MMVSKEETIPEWLHVGYSSLLNPFDLYDCLGVQNLSCASAQSGAGRLKHLLYELAPLLSLPYSYSPMALPNLSIPSISISLADDPPVHLLSPFDAQPPSPPCREDEYRSSFLSPPPLFSPRFHR